MNGTELGYGGGAGQDPPTVVIGIGDDQRHDAGVGPAVVARLRRRRLPGVRLVDSDGGSGQLLELWQDARMAVVIDAVRVEPPRPGVVHRRSLRHPSLRGRLPESAHSLELGWAVALAESLDRLPPVLLLFAVEVDDTSYGTGLSPRVSAAADRVAAETAQLAIRSARRTAGAWASTVPIGDAG